MIIDGKAIAERIYVGLEQRSEKPRLGIVVVGNDPVIDSFVRIKRRNAERLGIPLVERRLDIQSTQEQVIDTVHALVLETDGVIVQLPVPVHINTDAILHEIPLSHDVDGLSTQEGKRHVFAPVAESIAEILKQYAIDVAEKKIVVVGNGRLVGTPSAAMLRMMGGDVTVVTREQQNADAIANADIVVLGAGDPHFLKPGMIKEGCVLLDAGTSESAGKVVGDADPTCAEKCTIFTSVPGGIGPIAVAMIFKNLYTLAERR